jgi:uncharacterized protein with HEPN domain
MYDYCLAITERIDVYHIDEERFLTDAAISDMLLMPLVQIGELAARLTGEFRETYKEIPWQQIKDFRNLIVHDYDGLNRQWAWNDLKDDIPQLRKFCCDYQSRLDDSVNRG